MSKFSWQGSFLVEALGENWFPCLFLLLEAAHILWLMPPHTSNRRFCLPITSSGSDPPVSFLKGSLWFY